MWFQLSDLPTPQIVPLAFKINSCISVILKYLLMHNFNLNDPDIIGQANAWTTMYVD